MFNVTSLVTINYLLLKSYLLYRNFSVRNNNTLSLLHFIESGIPQGSLFVPLFFLIFVDDLPVTDNTKTALHTDDVDRLSINQNLVLTSQN